MKEKVLPNFALPQKNIDNFSYNLQKYLFTFYVFCIFRLNKTKKKYIKIKEKAVIKWSDWFLVLSCAIMSAKQLKLDLNISFWFFSLNLWVSTKIQILRWFMLLNYWMMLNDDNLFFNKWMTMWYCSWNEKNILNTFLIYSNLKCLAIII